jgi:ArsR family transcriptional regulator
MSKYSNEAIERLSQAFKALANANRLQIYLRLRSCCVPGTECAIDEAARCCVGDLGEDLDIALSTLSHHLKELNRAGLVNTRRQGKQVHCSVNPAMAETLGQFFNDFPQGD